MSGDGSVSGSISAEEMVDPAALRQEQLLGRLDAIAESQGKLYAAIDELDKHLRTSFDYTAEAQNKTTAAIDALQAKSVSDWNSFMGAIDGLNAGIARELGELLKGLGDGLADEIRKLGLEIPHCINSKVLHECDEIRREMRYLTGNVGSLSIIMDRRLKERRPAKPKRKRLTCGKCHKSFKNCKCRVFAERKP